MHVCIFFGYPDPDQRFLIRIRIRIQNTVKYSCKYIKDSTEANRRENLKIYKECKRLTEEIEPDMLYTICTSI